MLFRAFTKQVKTNLGDLQTYEVLHFFVFVLLYIRHTLVFAFVFYEV